MNNNTSNKNVPKLVNEPSSGGIVPVKLLAQIVNRTKDWNTTKWKCKALQSTKTVVTTTSNKNLPKLDNEPSSGGIVPVKLLSQRVNRTKDWNTTKCKALQSTKTVVTTTVQATRTYSWNHHYCKL